LKAYEFAFKLEEGGQALIGAYLERLFGVWKWGFGGPAMDQSDSRIGKKNGGS